MAMQQFRISPTNDPNAPTAHLELGPGTAPGFSPHPRLIAQGFWGNLKDFLTASDGALVPSLHSTLAGATLAGVASVTCACADAFALEGEGTAGAAACGNRAHPRNPRKINKIRLFRICVASDHPMFRRKPQAPDVVAASDSP